MQFVLRKCGDGRLIYLACDDGNYYDGDGCSSKCVIEAGYFCQNGSFWSASVCELIVDFSVSLYSIRRDDTANSGVIKL
jgi:cysteine-rich repeat protein